MIVVYCSAIACADFIRYRLYASHSSPLRTARKDDRKVILFFVLLCLVDVAGGLIATLERGCSH